jgi:hypothetical protein
MKLDFSSSSFVSQVGIKALLFFGGKLCFNSQFKWPGQGPPLMFYILQSGLRDNSPSEGKSTILTTAERPLQKVCSFMKTIVIILNKPLPTTLQGSVCVLRDLNLKKVYRRHRNKNKNILDSSHDWPQHPQVLFLWGNKLIYFWQTFLVSFWVKEKD